MDPEQWRKGGARGGGEETKKEGGGKVDWGWVQMKVPGSGSQIGRRTPAKTDQGTKDTEAHTKTGVPHRAGYSPTRHARVGGSRPKHTRMSKLTSQLSTAFHEATNRSPITALWHPDAKEGASLPPLSKPPANGPPPGHVTWGCTGPPSLPASPQQHRPLFR